MAARIAHCLTKRSLIAEYDDDQASATVFGMDTESFGVHLYRGSKKGPKVRIPLTDNGDGSAGRDTTSQTNETTRIARPDFSHGVVVEVTRFRGDAITFHRNCQAVLAGARGETDGVDDWRRPLGALIAPRFGFGDVGAGASWNRQKEGMRADGNNKRGDEEQSCANINQRGIEKLLLPPPLSSSLPPAHASVSSSRKTTTMPTQQCDVARSVCTVLETALFRIEQDRLDAQILGMQSLVLLTDLKSTRLEKAYLSSLCVLGSPTNFTASLDMNYSSSSLDCGEEEDDEGRIGGPLSTSIVTKIHKRIRSIIMQPGDDLQNDNATDRSNSSSSLSIEETPTSSHSSRTKSKFHQLNPELHISLRRMAILAFTNALYTVQFHSDRFPLLPPLHCPTLQQDDFIKRLALDLTGAARPPVAMLACAHDAALAARLLHLIVSYCSSENRGDDTINYGVTRDENCSAMKIEDISVGMPSRNVRDLLERAKVAGQSFHGVLEVEADRALHDLAVGKIWCNTE